MALPHQKGQVRVRHILAAADESEGGRAALLAAGVLGRATGVRVSVLTVIAPPADEISRSQALERLRAMVRDTLVQVPVWAFSGVIWGGWIVILTVKSATSIRMYRAG